MKRLSLSVFIALVALSLTACGGETTSEVTSENETQASNELTPIDVGVIPIVDVASVYLGVEEGIFEAHGLDVTLTQAQGGAAIVPAVLAGDLDFGFSNNSSLIIALDAGLQLKGVAPGPQSTGDPESDFMTVVAMEDSGIDSVEDLQGKRVAVNTLNNILDTTISEGVRNVGGDPESVKYVEIAPPEMLSQLEAGNIDAMVAGEPFLYFAEQAGAHTVYGLIAEPIDDLSVSSYFTTDSLIEEDPELVDRFTSAVRESQQFATDNPDKVRDILSTYMGIEGEVSDNIALPLFPQEINLASVEELARLLEESEVIEQAPTMEDLIYEGGTP